MFTFIFILIHIFSGVSALGLIIHMDGMGWDKLSTAQKIVLSPVAEYSYHGYHGRGHIALWGGTFYWCNTHFYHKAGKCRDYAPFFGKPKNWVWQNPEMCPLLTFDLNVPTQTLWLVPPKNILTWMCPSAYTWFTPLFVVNYFFVAITRFLGALLAQIWWWGAQKHFTRPGNDSHTFVYLVHQAVFRCTWQSYVLILQRF